MDTYFSDKVAVVTGAGGIICSQVSKDLAKQGMTVILIGRTLEKLEKTANAILENGGKCECFTCDVTDEKAIYAIADAVYAKYGRVDYLVNGAGGNNAKAQPNIVAFESVLKINTMGTFYPTLAFARFMVGKGGSIVNFASMNSYCPLTRNFSYAMSKAAVVNLTQSLAAYFANAGVRVNAVAPGFIVNERSKLILGTVEEGLTKRGQDVINHTPMGNFGKASDMSGAVKYLLDDRASGFVTGVTIPVDGGFLTLSGV